MSTPYRLRSNLLTWNVQGVITALEHTREANVVVLQPLGGTAPLLVRPFEATMSAPQGTLTFVLPAGGDVAGLLNQLTRPHPVELLQMPGNVLVLEFVPLRLTRALAPDDGEVHEVTVEYLKTGGPF